MSTLRLTTISNQSGSSSVPSDTVINGSAKAWVNFNGTGVVAIRASFNVSSITDNGTGDYTVNFSTAFADANYSAVATGNGPAINNFGRILGPYQVVPTTTAFRFNANDYGGTFSDLLYASVAVFR